MSPRVLVTGASRGVGRAVAERILADGQSLLGVYRTSAVAAQELRSMAPDRCEVLAADLFTDEGRASVLGGLAARSLHGAVLSAGVAEHAPFAAADVRGQIDADLVAPLLLVQGLLAADALVPGASIVFVGSNLGHRGLAHAAPYSAAKAGLEGAVRSLARELGPAGIRVNAVAPGLLRTDMTAHRGEDALATYAREVPLRRVGEASDVSGVIAFLLGADAGYMTGQVLDVDGGWGC